MRRRLRQLMFAAAWGSGARLACAQIVAEKAPAVPRPPATDWRNIDTGSVIPDEEYVDQPYIVRTDDGAWLCVLTTSAAGEGAASSRVLSTRSTDQGRTWSPLLALEAHTPPESAYATLVKAPAGRIYAFYNHNTDNVREIPSEVRGGAPVKRVDTLGHFVFKFTDDGGRSWSADRYVMPMRETPIDRANVTGGRTRIFWHVGRPLVHRNAVFVPFSKMVGVSNLSRSEAYFLRSDNLLTERDPAKIRWSTLPDGDSGLRSPAGIIAETDRRGSGRNLSNSARAPIMQGDRSAAQWLCRDLQFGRELAAPEEHAGWSGALQFLHARAQVAGDVVAVGPREILSRR